MLFPRCDNCGKITAGLKYFELEGYKFVVCSARCEYHLLVDLSLVPLKETVHDVDGDADCGNEPLVMMVL